MKKNEVMPIYQRISIDVAKLIASGNIKEGEQIYGRSSLAGKYNVSPETIRRAIKVLEDVEVVKSIQGSGSRVLSQDNAIKFVERYNQIGNLSSYKTKLIDTLNEIRVLEKEAMENIVQIIDYSSRLQSSTLIHPLEFKIVKESHIINKTISEVKFWQNTGGTIIGVKKGETVIISPGPYLKFEENDILIVIADTNQFEAIESYIRKEQ